MLCIVSFPSRYVFQNIDSEFSTDKGCVENAQGHNFARNKVDFISLFEMYVRVLTVQFAGVAMTFTLATSCRESIHRRISLKKKIPINPTKINTDSLKN